MLHLNCNLKNGVTLIINNFFSVIIMDGWMAWVGVFYYGKRN